MNRFLFIILLASLIALPVYAQEEEEATPTPTASPTPSAASKTKEEVASKEQEIADLDKQIKELQQKRNTTAAEADIIAQQLQILTQKLKKAELELSRTRLTITGVQEEQEENEETITELEQSIEGKRAELKSLVRILYEREQESLIRVFFASWSLSEVLAEQATYEELQERAIGVIKEMREKEEELTSRQQKLEQQEQDLGQLQQLLAAQQAEVASQRSEQNKFLQAKEEEKIAYENKIKEAKQARTEIEQHIFKLQSAGIEVSLNNAFDMARYAGEKTGVRPALLLGILKVESNLGNNIGSGKFPDDMHPQSRDAFLRITKKLGLDPYTAQISRRPASYKGWGGAMGPAQVMPATWETIEPRMMQLTGKSVVNPYDLADAFMATAIFLADRGAANRSGEYEAVSRYIAGPNWQYYTWYTDKVMAVAEEYEKGGI